MLAWVAACSKEPAGSSPASRLIAAPFVGGTYVGDGKAAVLTEVTAHKHEPFDGRAVTELIFSAKSQAGSADPAVDALFGKFGDALVARIEDDGAVVGVDVIHSGMGGGSVSIVGPIKTAGYKLADGQVSGRLTSGGPVEVFAHKVSIDLTFDAKAP
ncbi:MAG: hypothetical protein ACHP84_14570 [Caulobacterales bacterium]